MEVSLFCKEKKSFVGDLLLLFWMRPLKTSRHYYIYYADITLFYYVFKNAQNNEKARCYVQLTIQDVK